MKAMIVLTVSLVVSVDTYAEAFFVKTGTKTFGKIEIDLERNTERDIKFSAPSQLEPFTQRDKSIESGWITRREPSEVEQIVDAAFIALTGFLIIGINDSYDINSELRLSTHSGVVLFFFPFRDHYLYAHCGGDHHLIATTNEPNAETLKRMKSPEDLRSICQKPAEEEPQQEEQIES